MRLILKKEKVRPKAPKTATLKTIDNYMERLKAVEKYNSEVRKYNQVLTGRAQFCQRAVAGFGKKGKKK